MGGSKGLLTAIKNSAWVSLINFTNEGSENYLYVITKLFFFDQGSILCRASFGEKYMFFILFDTLRKKE